MRKAMNGVWRFVLGVARGRGAGRQLALRSLRRQLAQGFRICSDRSDRLATIVATAYFLQ